MDSGCLENLCLICGNNLSVPVVMDSPNDRDVYMYSICKIQITETASVLCFFVKEIKRESWQAKSSIVYGNQP